MAVLVAVASFAIAAGETRVLGHPVIEALVVALILGMLVRLAWRPGSTFEPGIRFAGKELLELSVVLLGISVDLPLLVRAGPALGLAIVSIVVVAVGTVPTYSPSRITVTRSEISLSSSILCEM